ncbi:acyl-CoA carboxylase epsilon subunit [Streptomyces sp. NPDC002730]|uniref:acyl-CoA carboxylase epsilon subunit n=1 Tax=Streptomyces sp. NPDC002730 TaxID=3364662 RepID=UPI0036881019
MSGPEEGAATPHEADGLRVVRGRPTEEELAAAVVAVTALLMERAAGRGTAPPRAGRRWGAPAQRMTHWPARGGFSG